MKRILILVLSADFAPFKKMIETSQSTWDSENIEGIESIYYCCGSHDRNTNKIIYLPIKDHYTSMGEKTLQALEWTLKHKSFDYIVRVNSSCYVDKKRLFGYVQQLPDNNLLAGVEADSQNGFRYLWGGMQWIASKDVIEKICENRNSWNHKYMEDESISLLAKELSIPFYPGKGCSINKTEKGWLLLSYPQGSESKEFTTFGEIKDCGHHFFRVKQEGDRDMDGYIMNQLYDTFSKRTGE